MKKRIFAFIVTALVIFGCFSPMVNVSADGTAKHNFVIVLDASGSMNQTDPSGLRYDALQQFLFNLNDSGDYVGDVVFTQTIDNQLDLFEIQNRGDKDKVLDNLKSIVPAKGDTNIGLALAAATDMLDSKRNTSLDSVIVLLSDGNTDLNSQSALDESAYYKEYGINHAKSEKYPIYCIGLNANGKMNGAELRDIADSTGGQFVEVSKASDLSKVAEMFHSLINNTPLASPDKAVIGNDGLLEKKFDVPDVGIEEVNIIIRGNTSSIEIIQPDGSKMPQNDVDSNTLKQPGYTNVKLIKPARGEWSAIIHGDPGSQVEISMISNVDLSIRAEIESPRQVYKKGDIVRINAIIESKGSDVSDQNIYDSNNIVLKLKDNKTNQDEPPVTMQFQNGKAVADVTLSKTTTYEGFVELTAGNITRESGQITLNVDNMPPEVLLDPIKDEIVLWPFKDNSKTFDLSQYVKDDNDTVLKYTLDSCSYRDGDVTLDNGMMKVNPSVAVNGTITVMAADSQGAQSPINFKINVVNVGLITIIIIGIIILIVLGIFAFFAIKVARMKYYGKLMIEIFDKNSGMQYNRQIHEPYRGKQPIRNLDMSAMDVGLEGVFSPKNTAYITYESKRPFYCTTSPDRSVPVKKIDIALGMTVTISDSEDFLSGANITYM